MEDSGAILIEISCLKDMLDQVNEEIEANIQRTREIESEIVKCSEVESGLTARESDLTKSLYLSQFEINGLLTVAADVSNSVKVMEEKLCSLKNKRDQMLASMNTKRERFLMQCLEFQREIDKGGTEELTTLISEKEFLENEIDHLEKKNNSLKGSMSAFVEEVLDDLYDSNSALEAEISNANLENQRLLQDIAELKTQLYSRSAVNNGKRVAA